MDIQSLHSLLAASLGPQASACLDRFFPELPEAQPERDLAWLYEQKLIGFRELEEVITHIPIKTGDFPEIQQRSLPYDFLLMLGQGAMGVVHLAKGGQLLGVTSLELSLDRLLPDLLKLPEQAGIHQLSLLDAEGCVIVKIGNQAQDRLQTESQTSLLNPAVLRQHSNGVIHLPDGSLQAFFLLGSLNWYYLIELESPL